MITNSGITVVITVLDLRVLQRTPPSLGFWPKLGSSTAVPRSLLLRGNGKSKGCMSPSVRTPKSSDPPMRKVPHPNQRKTLRPMGRRSPPGRVDTPRAQTGYLKSGIRSYEKNQTQVVQVDG